MTFVQIIDCKTSRVDDMNRLLDTWVEQTEGKRTATHAVAGTDRSRPDHLVEIVEFPSYEQAMKNSQLPETNRIYQEMVALCEEPPTFTDLDVVRDEQLNKATCRRFFEEVVNRRNLDLIDELFTSDYQDHDPVNEVDTVGPQGVREEVAMYLRSFDVTFTIDNQLAEGDQVTTRWSCRAIHSGEEFMGVAPTGKTIDMTGITIHRLREGKIAEGWWNWDNLGMLRQVGVIQM